MSENYIGWYERIVGIIMVGIFYILLIHDRNVRRRDVQE